MPRVISLLAFLGMPSLVIAQITVDPAQIPTLMEALGKLGVGFALAGFMIWIYRRDLREKNDDIARMKKEHSEERERDLLTVKADREFYIAQWKGQADILMRVVIDNTAAMMASTKTSEALHRREDQIVDVLTKMGYELKVARVAAVLDDPQRG